MTMLIIDTFIDMTFHTHTYIQTFIRFISTHESVCKNLQTNLQITCDVILTHDQPIDDVK